MEVKVSDLKQLVI